MKLQNPVNALSVSVLPYQEILLNLLVQLIQFAFSVLQLGAGLMMTLFPLVKILLIQILVGQGQGPQAIPCKLLHRQNMRYTTLLCECHKLHPSCSCFV